MSQQCSVTIQILQLMYRTLFDVKRTTAVEDPISFSKRMESYKYDYKKWSAKIKKFLHN